MDRNAFARFFATTRQFLRWRTILVCGVALVVLTPTFLMHLFFWRIEHRLNIRVHRKPYISFLPGTIDLHRVSLDWQDRLHVREGSLKINFPPLEVWLGEYSVTLLGQNLAVEFGSDLQKTLGAENVVFDRVSAKFLIRGKKDFDVEYLDAESKTFQFHLKGQQQTQRTIETES